jgi:hypothetical protein
MTERILIITMAALGLALSSVTPSSVSPGLAKAMTWLIAGIFSKFK